jgi:hypothetical protein
MWDEIEVVPKADLALDSEIREAPATHLVAFVVVFGALRCVSAARSDRQPRRIGLDQKLPS